MGGKTLYRVILPWLALTIYLIMVGIGESKVRSSPNWPPPERHELGAWTIEDPPILRWAGALNLPAAIPVAIMWSTNDRIGYLVDDHNLITYVPSVFFVWGLWYFVAYRAEQIARGRKTFTRYNRQTRYFVYAAQIILTLELAYFGYCAANEILVSGQLICFWLWVVFVCIAWADTIREWKLKTPVQEISSLI